MVKDVVATVDSVVPGVPYRFQQGIAAVLLEVVEVVAVLGGYGHGLEEILVGSVAQLVDEPAYSGLDLAVAGIDSLVEVRFRLVEVAFGDAVARILLEEFSGAGCHGKCRSSKAYHICRSLHSLYRLMLIPTLNVRGSG